LYLGFVKKGISIFFLLLFFVFQYGKMLDYMECRIQAAIEATPDCGCETKLTGFTENDPFSAPYHQHQLKNYTEEFFDQHFSLLPALPEVVSKQYQLAAIQPVPEGCNKSIFQPPKSLFISLSI
jgi:hypothetical protein